MPEAVEYQPPSSKDRATEDFLNTERRERAEAFEKAWEYYSG